MNALHIACGQFEASPGDKRSNIDAMDRLTAEAAARGCELVVFPEMALTGYLPPEKMPPLAEATNGESVGVMGEIAKSHAIAIAFGFPEIVTGDDRKRNRSRSNPPPLAPISLSRWGPGAWPVSAICHVLTIRSAVQR